MPRCGYLEALERLDLLVRLSAFDPRVAGTPPLGLALPDSDIDVLCHAPDPLCFSEDVWTLFASEDAFVMKRWVGEEQPVIASFAAHGWTIELFGHPRPVEQQDGWRHFQVERQLVELGGEAFRSAVMTHRRAGMKTEPAFAAALNLGGDPYAALLTLDQQTDAELAALLTRAGFLRPSPD